VEFEWDPNKAASNRRKHGISFIEAATVFGDGLSRTRLDRRAAHEDRCVTIGTSERGRLLVVVYAERGERIRVISARRATPNERRKYEESD
jgi:uncharacterized DUF497 family protein